MQERTKKAIFWGVVGTFALFLIVWTAAGKMEAPFTWQTAGTWLAAFLSLAILSFLYDDNPIYKLAESLFIGVSAGYYMVQGVWEQLIKNLFTKLWPEVAQRVVDFPAVPAEPAWAPFAPELAEQAVYLDYGPSYYRFYYLIPLILGVLLLMRLSPKGGWIARWPLAFIVGWTAGTNLERYLTSDFTRQVDPSLIPLIVMDAEGIAWMASVTNVVLVGGVLCALIYFFFSVEHKGVFGHASKAGIWILMITFGAAFGYTVMGRIALLVGRMEFLFVDWMKVIGQ